MIKEYKNLDHSMVYQVVNIVLKVVMSVCVVVTMVMIWNIGTMINEMGSMMYYQMGYSNANNTVVQESSQTASQTPTLYSNEYFKSHSIKPNNATELYELIGNNDVFVYFYMTTCGYCTLTAPYVEQYIKDGKTESMPIYFIDASMLDWVWGGEGNNRSNITDTDIDITGTPTMLAFRSDKTIQEGIGPYEISAMLGYEYQE